MKDYLQASHSKIARLVTSAALLLTAGLYCFAASAGEHKQTTVATIEATVKQEVRQDYVRVSFQTRAAADSAANVNTTLSQALEKAQRDLQMPDGVSVSTGGFSVYPNYDKDGVVKGWAGRAGLIVTGKNLDGVTRVIAHLGKTLAIGSIQFSLSPEARQEQEQLLFKQLGQAFKQKAKMTAEAFGFERFEIRSLNFLKNRGVAPMSTMNLASPRMSGASGPNVSLEPAMTTVSLSVTGRISLK